MNQSLVYETKVALMTLAQTGFFEQEIASLEKDATLMLMNEAANPKDSNLFKNAFSDFCSRRFQLNSLLELAKKAKRELEEKKKG